MYSTVTDVRSALFPGAGAEPTEDKTTAASLPNEQIVDAINEADSTVNTYLSVPGDRKVTMENDAATQPVRYWSRNIAAYLATLTFRRGKDLGQDDPVRLRYTATIGLLTAIRDGKTGNPLEPADPAPGSGGIEVFNQYDGNLFSPDDFFGPVTRHSNYPGPTKIWPGY